MTRSQTITLATGGTVHGTASTVTGSGVVFREVFREAMVTLNVTAAATLVGDTFDVMIDTSTDGGTTWVNIGHFTQVLGNGGTKQFVMALRGDNPGANAVTLTSADAAAGATRQFGIGDRLRYRSTNVGTGSFTFGITAFLK